MKTLNLTRLHLITADEPLIEHQDLIPLCQLPASEPKPSDPKPPEPQKIPRAVFELRFTEDACRDVEDMLDMVIGLCPDCRQLVLEGRYIYGIRAGAEKIAEEDAQFSKEKTA